MAIHDDEGRHVRHPPEGLDRLAHPLRIICVANSLHVPAIGEAARPDILAECEIGMPLDRYPVAVVYPA
jgi:hypothetical protein